MTLVATRSVWPQSMTGKAEDIFIDWLKPLLVRYAGTLLGDRQKVRVEHLTRFDEADTDRQTEDLDCP